MLGVVCNDSGWRYRAPLLVFVGYRGSVDALVDDHLQPASKGRGPLVQRDYWAVIRACRINPQEVMAVVRSDFKDLAPRHLVRFSNPEKPRLDEGDEMSVNIQMGPRFAVRVVDISPESLTVATLAGHAEAGKITFGAYYNPRGDVIFHIRSRARSKSLLHRAGFVAGADAMQTNTWTDFIDRLAHAIGDGVVGEIVAESCEVEEEPTDRAETTPTFIARSD